MRLFSTTQTKVKILTTNDLTETTKYDKIVVGIKPIQNEKGLIKMKNTHSHTNTDTEKVHVNAITSNLNTAKVLTELQESEFNNIIENTDMGEEEATKAGEQYANDMVQDVEELLESYGYHYFNDMCGVDLLTKLQEYKTKRGN